MSKAEDRANEIYNGDTPITRLRRKDYCDGYHQAEKDNELTWEDIEKIDDITLRLDASAESRGMSNQEFYQEVLKRFKNYKERKGL